MSLLAFHYLQLLNTYLAYIFVDILRLVELNTYYGNYNNKKPAKKIIYNGYVYTTHSIFNLSIRWKCSQ